MTGMRAGGVILHCMGIDALAAITVAAGKMDKTLGTRYSANVEMYRKYLQKEDLGITGAITDVKGDRSLHPSKQVQHPDFYLRIVDRQKEGIVVRGAKIHISATPCADEAIIVPCRTHGEEDKDYALSFAVPLNAKGIKLLAVEPMVRVHGEEARFDYPVADDPADRVPDYLRRCFHTLGTGFHVWRVAVFPGYRLCLCHFPPTVWRLEDGSGTRAADRTGCLDCGIQRCRQGRSYPRKTGPHGIHNPHCRGPRPCGMH